METPLRSSERNTEQLTQEAENILDIIKTTSPGVRQVKEKLVGKILDAQQTAKLHEDYAEGLHLLDAAYRALGDIFHNDRLTRHTEADCLFMSLGREILIDLSTLPSSLQKEVLLRDGTLFEHEQMLRDRTQRVLPISLPDFARCIRACTEQSLETDLD